MNIAAKPVPVGRPKRRVGVADAKMHLSALLRDVARGGAVIHNRGKDVAVVLSVDDYDRLATAVTEGQTRGSRFMTDVAALKRRLGGGVDDFEPERAAIDPGEFPPRRRG